MNSPSFAPILDRVPKDIEKPKTLPVGTYIWLTRGIPKQDKSSVKKTDYVEFTVVPQGPAVGDNGNLDVDQEELDAALTRKGGDKIAIQSKAQRLTFYLTEDALWRLEDFMKHIGFPIDEYKEQEDAPSLRQMLAESGNRQFAGYVTHKPSEDGTQMYANITKTFALE